MTSILVVSPLASHPPQNGARRRIHTMLTALKQQGHRIHFVYTACEKVDIDRVTRLMKKDWDSVDVFPSGHDFAKTQGEDYGLDDWINPALCEAMPELAERYGITHCLLNYIFQTKYFDTLPSEVVRILDTHDRLARRALFADMGSDPGFYYTTEAEEMRGLARADVVLAIQDNEAEYFARAGKPVVVVGHMAPVASIEKRFTKFERIGYIGAHNKFNIHALERFIPAFAEYVEGLETPLTLSIAGNAAKHFKADPAFQFDCISYDGFVQDLDAYFEGIDLYVNPTLRGTGLKIKSVEALSYGMPVVSTRVGWDGLLAEPGMHDAEDIDGLIAAIEAIRLKGFDALTKLSNFSKASFAEYQLNLEHNLRSLFSLPLGEMLNWAEAHPHYIGTLQDRNPDFLTLDRVQARPETRRRPVIAHVVNPVRMPRGSDLYIAQPVVFRSMAAARDATAAADVTLVSRRFPEDDGYLSDCFDLDLRLQRSAQDLDGIPEPRKLPLLGEVFSLEGLPEEVTHIVYTNSDIGLQPHFYDFVAARIAEEHDALVINRRTMSKRFTRPDELNELYTEFGQKHPGFDCFVVSREVLERAEFGDTLVGVHLIGRVVFWNILARARKIGYYDDHHLTFHIGDDVPSKGRGTLPYIRHNLEQGTEVVRRLRQDPGRFADPARQERFDRVLQVSPGEIQGRFDPATDPHHRVQLHSFFRTGSTYLYQKIRARKTWTAYYEPFHEDLALFSSDRLEHFRKRHDNSQFRHQQKADDTGWLFKEYEPLMDHCTPGTYGYDRRMSYMHGFDGAAEAVTAYVDGLVDTAVNENVFLQFNRTALRQEWMRGLFPEDFHIYLQRGLRNIWGSYLSFRSDAVYGFLRNNLAVVNFNAEDPLMQALAAHVPVAKAGYHPFFHKNFNEIFHHYTLEQHYLIQAVFWYEARSQATRAADLIVDLEQIAQDRLLRLETEAALAAQRMDISFRDLTPSIYDTSQLLLSEAALERCEALAQDIVAEAARARDAGAPLPAPARTHETEELEAAFARFKHSEADVFRDKLLSVRKSSLKAAPTPPEVTPGETYHLQEMKEAGMLAFGFHHPERHHVWASGSFAMLRLAVPETADRDADHRLTLRLHVHPQMAARYLESFVYLNGRLAGEQRLGSSWEEHSFTVPGDLIGEDGILEIGLVAPRFFDGKPKGARRMSFCLSQLTLDMAAPAEVDDPTATQVAISA